MPVTIDEVHFKWEMTREDYKRFSHPNDIMDNYCGAVYFGKCKCEFVFECCDHGFVSFTNLYVLDVDSGYSSLKDGTPYAHFDDCVWVDNVSFPTFRVFKLRVMQDIVKQMNSGRDVLIKYGLGETQFERWHQPIAV